MLTIVIWFVVIFFGLYGVGYCIASPPATVDEDVAKAQEEEEAELAYATDDANETLLALEQMDDSPLTGCHPM